MAVSTTGATATAATQNQHKIRSMDDSIAHPPSPADSVALPAWKRLTSMGSAVVVAIIMLVAGIWKITEPLAAATRMNQALVPAVVSLPAAIGFGIAETFSGLMLLVPRFRRWGAWLAGLLLVAFLVYIGIHYNRLHGAECNCFPIIQRAVGPAFFVGDGIMLLLAALAGLWSSRPHSARSALLALAAIGVFAGVSYGVAVTQTTGTRAPDSIMVDGKPVSLQQGRILLYFFDPECTECLMAAQDMATYDWRKVRIIVIPTERKFLAQSFLDTASLKASISSDLEKLRRVYKFGDPPFAVALENGRTVAELRVFEGNEPKATLRKLGFVK